jgi:hypothetical protein
MTHETQRGESGQNFIPPLTVFRMQRLPGHGRVREMIAINRSFDYVQL